MRNNKISPLRSVMWFIDTISCDWFQWNGHFHPSYPQTLFCVVNTLYQKSGWEVGSLRSNLFKVVYDSPEIIFPLSTAHKLKVAHKRTSHSCQEIESTVFSHFRGISTKSRPQQWLTKAALGLQCGPKTLRPTFLLTSPVVWWCDEFMGGE